MYCHRCSKILTIWNKRHKVVLEPFASLFWNWRREGSFAVTYLSTYFKIDKNCFYNFNHTGRMLFIENVDQFRIKSWTIVRWSIVSDPSEGGVLFVITASMIREIEEALSTRPFSSIRAAKWSTVPNLGNPRLSNLTFRAKLFIEFLI